MVSYYSELLGNGLNRGQIENKVKNGELYKISRGLYSNQKLTNELEIITKKYPNAILTLNSAFFYYDLTDKIPEYYYLATDRKSKKISDKKVKQIYTKKELLNIGATKEIIDGVTVNIYDKERMLIELIRYKTKLPFELYKEVINSYRKIKNDINFIKLSDYAQSFNSAYIMKTIEMEVM